MFFFFCLCISFPQDNSLAIQTAQHRWNCLHCSCCFLLLLLWRGSALHTCLPSGLYQVNLHPSQQRRRLLWGCHSTIIHSFIVCSGAYSFHKCFFVLVCTCVCVCRSQLEMVEGEWHRSASAWGWPWSCGWKRWWRIIRSRWGCSTCIHSQSRAN